MSRDVDIQYIYVVYFLPAKLLYDGLFFANKSIKAFLISNSNSSPTNVGG